VLHLLQSFATISAPQIGTISVTLRSNGSSDWYLHLPWIEHLITSASVLQVPSSCSPLSLVALPAHWHAILFQQLATKQTFTYLGHLAIIETAQIVGLLRTLSSHINSTDWNPYFECLKQWQQLDWQTYFECLTATAKLVPLLWTFKSNSDSQIDTLTSNIISTINST
jgi:hypothetical protein